MGHEGFRQLKARALKLESETKQVKQSHRRVEAVASRQMQQLQSSLRAQLRFVLPGVSL